MKLLYRLALSCFLLQSAIAGAASVEAKPQRIMMILYRGMTDAEKGFVEYFKRRQLPVEFIVRDAHADADKIADFVLEAKTLRPDLIYTFGTTVTTEVVGLDGAVDANRHITDIPVVFNIVADPVGAGLVKSLNSSGRNLTGASHMVPLRAQMQALQAMRPTHKLGVIYNPQEKNSMLAVQELQRLAPALSLSLQLVAIRAESTGRPSAEGLAAAMQELVAKRPQFIYMPSDSFLIKNASEVVRMARNAGIPVFAATEAPVRENGALLGLVSTYTNVGELAASKAEQILSGKVSASQLRIESLNRFTYLVNMKSAKALHTYPPLAVMKFAELIAPVDMADALE